jgi:hypothetical protein
MAAWWHDMAGHVASASEQPPRESLPWRRRTRWAGALVALCCTFIAGWLADEANHGWWSALISWFIRHAGNLQLGITIFLLAAGVFVFLAAVGVSITVTTRLVWQAGKKLIDEADNQKERAFKLVAAILGKALRAGRRSAILNHEPDDPAQNGS